MTERVQKAIDVFLDAINQGTLAKGNCHMCAVGNLVREGMLKDPNHKVLRNKVLRNDVVEVGDINNANWNNLFYTTNEGIQIIIDHEENDWYYERGLKAISYTDFSEDELAQIEHTFETNTNIHFLKYCCSSKEEIRKDQIKGLEAVVKVMLTFDDCKEDVIEVFTNKAELITI